MANSHCSKKTFCTLLLCILLCILHSTASYAQERYHFVSFGEATQIDTYLSPDTYSGSEVRWIEESTRQHRDARFSHTWQSMGYVANTETRSSNNSNLSTMFGLSYGLHRNIRVPEHFRLAVGAAAEGFLGVVYNTRNGNNPAQLRAGVNIAPSVRASYDLNLFRRNFRLNYQARLPIVGLHFSPAFGQSYYEIFARGNYDHNICLASPFNALSFEHRITLDLRLKRRTISIGYLGDYRQAELNEIKTKHITHGVVIGWR